MTFFQTSLLHASLFLYLVVLLQNSPAQETPCYEISGKVTQSSQYCGGAAPPPELLEQLHQPHPYQINLYIREGDTNKLSAPIIDTLEIDTAGQYSVCLPPGSYCIIQEEHLNKKVLEKYLSMPKNSKQIQVNRACLKKWWREGVAKLEIKDQPVTDLDFHYTKRCFLPIGIPCLAYTGPMPP